MTINDIKYERPDVGGLIKTIETAREEFLRAGSAKEQFDIFTGLFDEIEFATTMLSLAFIRFTLNTKDEFYVKEKEYIDGAAPSIDKATVDFLNALPSSRHLTELKKLIPPVLFKNIEIKARTISDKVLEDLAKENAVVSEYVKLMAGITVDFRGVKLPPTLLQKYFTDADRETRKEAYFAYGRELEKYVPELDRIYGELVGLRTDIAKKLGYKNYVGLGYDRQARNCYDENMVAAFRENVYTGLLPVISGIYGAAAKKIGVGQRYLYDHDIFSEKSAAPFGTPEEILQSGREMYEALAPEAAKLINDMTAFGSFDVLSREGKWGGGYCSSLEYYKMPFILANFNGSFHDVSVLTHEVGHALHYAEAVKHVAIKALISPTFDACEIASMAMEFFTHKYMDKFFGADAEKYRFEHYARNLAFIPYGINVDAFQHFTYHNPGATPDERNAEWLRLEKKFRPHMSLEGIPFFETGRGWQIKQHIFELPFYYIDYCLAQTIALQFAALADKDFKDAFSRYLKLLRAGGTLTFTELVEGAGLVSPFAKGALGAIAKQLSKLQMTNDK